MGTERDGAHQCASCPSQLWSTPLGTHLPPKAQTAEEHELVRLTDPHAKSSHQTFSQGTLGHD